MMDSFQQGGAIIDSRGGQVALVKTPRQLESHFTASQFRKPHQSIFCSVSSLLISRYLHVLNFFIYDIYITVVSYMPTMIQLMRCNYAWSH